MITCVALWRAVNLGPHNKVSMKALCDMLAGLGLHDVRSLLQSGNAVFRTDLSRIDLEAAIERATAARLGVATDVFVRSAEEWQRIVRDNPFPREATNDPGHLVMFCLKKAPTGASVSTFRRTISGRELVETRGRHAYVVYPDGIGRSRVTLASLEKGLGGSATGRNWNTVLKLAALSQPRP